jgi:hypothetical protein
MDDSGPVSPISPTITTATPAWYEQFFVKIWKLCIQRDNKMGYFMTTDTYIPQDSIVLVCLPVNLKHKTDMDPSDFNRAIQISADLFSCSETPQEYNNFISHSCDPCCKVEIDENNIIYLVSIRDIEPGDIIDFDYNTTEHDMISQGVDFACHCRAPTCKKWIRGKNYE